MIRIRVALTLLASWILLPVGCLRAQSQPQSDGPKRYIYLLPEGFHGWVCIDFNFAGALPLPREGDALIIRVRPGEILKASNKAIEPKWEAWIEAHGQRRPLPEGITSRKIIGMFDLRNPVQRECNFFGTVEDAAMASEPDHPPLEVPVSPDELQALVALYKATDGDHWKNHSGWLGAPGTECEWHGISCGYDRTWIARITEVELYDNNLAGTIPQELGGLRHLTLLALFGNRLSGRIPPQLVERWLAGSLALSAEAPLLTDVSEIDFESASTAILCDFHHRIQLFADGRLKLFSKRCRKATPSDRETFCEVKEGQAKIGVFARLAWLIESSGFYNLQPEYSRNITDAGLERTRVLRQRKFYQVTNYATSGPQELWVVQRAIEGAAFAGEWESTTTRAKCPRWSDAMNSGLE